ncbi:hypothetical protein JTB14_027342 [Gonioctena quinquepunctata]|nr:hypothetical protein JTB14_027342 [Gonioctena quinquepunctata]
MQTSQKCNEIINLEKGNVEQTDLACAESNQNLDNHNSHCQSIHRKRTTSTTNLPTQTKTNPPRQNFPKVWMYLSKVPELVTEVNIQDFLKGKTGDSNDIFIVKDLREKRTLKSFVIAADFKYKELFYELLAQRN